VLISIVQKPLAQTKKSSIKNLETVTKAATIYLTTKRDIRVRNNGDGLAASFDLKFVLK
jgi:hypothetical protein